MLIDDLKKDVMDSLKKGEAVRVDTLRFLISAVRNIAIAKYGNSAESSLTDCDVLEIVKKQVKTHRESIEAFRHGGREDLAQKEQAQLAILETFLPAQMSDEELRSILAPIISSSNPSTSAAPQNFGLLMKRTMELVGGKADGGRVAVVLKQLIQGS